ncbi:unnamed protein product [Thlaspi arvense]|uniref:Uncharacterized protein n=1 Tax=Thlaspi arvense TaxID=13288 RepID=A0AAU9RHL8_THLAR|nr:unnamed protein product [Thlaspi arvense]
MHSMVSTLRLTLVRRMEKEGCLVWWLVLALQFFILQLAACTQHGRLPLNDIENEFQPIGGEPAPGVDLQILDHQVVMSNGLVSVTFSRPRGEITGIEFNGIDNLLETSNGKADRGK